MSQRTAIVTGAASGIGRATAALFRAQDWKVIGIDRDWSATRPDGDIDLDISDLPRWAECLASVGPVHALVNNAAVSRPTPLGQIGPGGWRDLFAVNLEAAAVAIDTLTPVLRETKGAVINVASVHALATSDGMAAYAASKAGLVGLTRAAAVELGPAGIRVNAIAPGAIESPMLFPNVHGAERDDSLRRLRERTPLRRVGKPDEIAATALFLADPSRSGYITGQCLVADGGALARLATE